MLQNQPKPKKDNKVIVIEIANVSEGFSNKVMYAATKITGGKPWKQVVLNDSGADLDFVGAVKAKKDHVKTTMNRPDYIKVTDVQGNPVMILGWANYFLSPD